MWPRLTREMTAYLFDRILKGAKPAEAVLDSLVHVETDRRLGVWIPSLLRRVRHHEHAAAGLGLREVSPDQVAGRRFFNVSSTPGALARRCLSRWPSDGREARDRLKHSQAGKGRPLVSGATNGVTIMPTT